MMTFSDLDLYSRNITDPTVAAYMEYMRTVATLFNGKETYIREFVRQSFDLEREIAKVRMS